MAVKIRVLHIVTRLAVRGVPRHVLDMANGLDTQRFAVEVVAGRSEPGEGDLSEEARGKGLILHLKLTTLPNLAEFAFQKPYQMQYKAGRIFT